MEEELIKQALLELSEKYYELDRAVKILIRDNEKLMNDYNRKERT